MEPSLRSRLTKTRSNSNQADLILRLHLLLTVRRERKTAFRCCSVLRLAFLGSLVRPAGTEGQEEALLGRALLGGGWCLCHRGGGGRGGSGTLQGAQSFAEPGVFGGLDLVHQDSPLVLQLLQGREEEEEEEGGR